MFNLTENMLRKLLESASRESLPETLDALAASMGDDAFACGLAREIVARTRPHEAVPEVYARYRGLVRDGIEFFLSQVSRERLVELALGQLKLAPEADSRQRLLELAKGFPTLHKLGQIIARNPHMDPGVKKWLVQLENGPCGTPWESIAKRLDAQLQGSGRRSRVRIQPPVLSEASVGAVARFLYRPPSSRERVQGVFKVLKPAVRKHLHEESTILEKTAAFFENNRSRYPFKDFRFLEVFREVREMLAKEIDLAAEQACLGEAAEFFADMEDVRIPPLLPLGTDAMTAMGYLEGPKITDAALSPEQREAAAGVLFEALVCRPLFCRRESSLFHGDPHAGNILAVEDPVAGRVRVGLLDWTLAGRLSRGDRLKTVRLIQAVVKKDLSGMRRAVRGLTIDSSWDDPACRKRFRQLALGLVHSPSFARLSQIKKTFKLLEELAYEGFVFPADLMLFRKAIFTLEGVVHDLCPSFDMDAAVRRYLAVLIAKEVPSRMVGFLFPLADKAENYPSLISNMELQSLLAHQCMDAAASGYRSLAERFWLALNGAKGNPL